MDRNSIDKFFESFSKDVLKEKWDQYNKYSENDNQVTINDLISVWNVYYENTFVYHEPELNIQENLVIIESETSFGLFFCNLAK